MKKNYRITITDGQKSDSFTLLGISKKAVRELCDICHIGTGWKVKDVELATKKKSKSIVSQLCLF